jgi:hypothetical protein
MSYYKGHFDIWLINNLQETIALTSDLVPDSRLIAGSVNGNLYKHTTEVFGILPVPDDVHASCEM